MRTQKQIESARRNGSKSNGPVTAEGKAKSSMNALKHGLAADPDIIMETENDDNYDRLLQAYIDSYQPANGDEYDLICQVVSASWRLRRIGRIEVGILERAMGLELETASTKLNDRELEAKAFRGLSAGRSIDLMLRYTTVARRNYDAALKALRDVQRERQKAEKQNEPENAKPVKKSATSKSSRGEVVPFPTPEAITETPSHRENQDDSKTARAEDGERHPLLRKADETVQNGCDVADFSSDGLRSGREDCSGSPIGPS